MERRKMEDVEEHVGEENEQDQKEYRTKAVKKNDEYETKVTQM